MKNFDLFYQCHVHGQDSAIWQLKCHLRIICESFGQQIVIISPQNCEISWFIPSQIEKLVTQIVHDFQLNPDQLVWLERDPNYASRQICTEYSQVTFRWDQAIATDPQWRSLSNELLPSIIGVSDATSQIYFQPIAHVFKSHIEPSVFA